MMQARRTLRTALLWLLCLGAAAAACAQGRGGPGGGMGHGGMGGGGMGGGMNPAPIGGNTPYGTRSSIPSPTVGQRGQSPMSMRPGLQLGPPGRWWDDKSFVKSLKLRPDQQTRMDAIFEQNRSALLSRYQSLQQAQSQMEEISRSPNLDEATVFAGIDRVTQAQAELEKAYSHMLLQIRKEMDADQLQRLEKHRQDGL